MYKFMFCPDLNFSYPHGHERFKFEFEFEVNGSLAASCHTHNLCSPHEKLGILKMKAKKVVIYSSTGCAALISS